jgi:hypothetical protein
VALAPHFKPQYPTSQHFHATRGPPLWSADSPSNSCRERIFYTAPTATDRLVVTVGAICASGRRTARGGSALPRQNPSTGLVWRIARPVDSRVLEQVSEADVGPGVVVVFRAVGRGSATVRFALTRGDSSGKALKSATYRVTVR